MSGSPPRRTSTQRITTNAATARTCPGVMRRRREVRAADITPKGTQCCAQRDPRTACHKCGGGGASHDVVESSALQALGTQRLTDLSRPASDAGAPLGVRPTSCDRLFDEESARVAAIARRVLGDPAAAEDVAQEVFFDLHRRFGDNPGAKAAAWARTAAAHTALNEIRTNRRRAARDERFGA